MDRSFENILRTYSRISAREALNNKLGEPAKTITINQFHRPAGTCITRKKEVRFIHRNEKRWQNILRLDLKRS